MTAWDVLAEDYDRTRGGEERGDEYAADVNERLPGEGGPVLEIGVGTGVVALGLMRRGRRVLGIDLSAPMLSRAAARLGPCLVRGDACRLPFAAASVAHAVSVWVLHAIDRPDVLLAEVARVLRPGGRYVVATTQRPAPDDPIGAVMEDLRLRLDGLVPPRHGPGPLAPKLVAWAGAAGFAATVDTVTREWESSSAEEMAAISGRQWPALRRLDDDTFASVAGPALEALAAMPADATTRRASCEIVALTLPL